VALHAVLGEAEIGCGDLSRLAEGDVLVLNQDLTATVKLLNADGALVSQAQLGTRDGRLALHLV
jgi:flagellar motor switch protein FliM